MDANELKAITEAVAGALANRQATPPAPAIMPLSAMQPAGIPGLAAPGPIGVAVAITIPLPDGSEASAYIALDPSALSTLPQTIAMLQQQGWPIRCFQPRQNTWGRPSWSQNSYGRRWGR